MNLNNNSNVDDDVDAVYPWTGQRVSAKINFDDVDDDYREDDYCDDDNDDDDDEDGDDEDEIKTNDRMNNSRYVQSVVMQTSRKFRARRCTSCRRFARCLPCLESIYHHGECRACTGMETRGADADCFNRHGDAEDEYLCDGYLTATGAAVPDATECGSDAVFGGCNACGYKSGFCHMFPAVWGLLLRLQQKSFNDTVSEPIEDDVLKTLGDITGIYYITDAPDYSDHEHELNCHFTNNLIHNFKY